MARWSNRATADAVSLGKKTRDARPCAAIASNCTPLRPYIDLPAQKKVVTCAKISRRQRLCKKLAVSAPSRGEISILSLDR